MLKKIGRWAFISLCFLAILVMLFFGVIIFMQDLGFRVVVILGVVAVLAVRGIMYIHEFGKDKLWWR